MRQKSSKILETLKTLSSPLNISKTTIVNLIIEVFFCKSWSFSAPICWTVNVVLPCLAPDAYWDRLIAALRPRKKFSHNSCYVVSTEVGALSLPHEKQIQMKVNKTESQRGMQIDSEEKESRGEREREKERHKWKVWGLDDDVERQLSGRGSQEQGKRGKEERCAAEAGKGLKIGGK